MFLLTTFIATLFVTQIVHAVPQPCQYSISPQLSTTEEHFRNGNATYTAQRDSKYDKGATLLTSTTCSQTQFAKDYPKFKDVPLFGKIGGAFNTPSNKPPYYPCGAIWELTNAGDESKSAFFVAIDSSSVTGVEFALSNSVFKALGGSDSTQGLKVEAKIVGYIRNLIENGE